VNFPPVIILLIIFFEVVPSDNVTCGLANKEFVIVPGQLLDMLYARPLCRLKRVIFCRLAYLFQRSVC